MFRYLIGVVAALLLVLPLVAQAVTLTWTYTQGAPPVAQATQFNVYRLTGACPAPQIVLPFVVPPGFVRIQTQNVSQPTGGCQCSFVDTNLTSGNTYCWLVTASGAGLESEPSNMVSFQVPTQPTAPTTLQVTNP